MHSDWPFSDFPRAEVDRSQDVIYLLNPELRIVYCNPAWDKFAKENGGSSAASCRQVSGTDLFSYISDDLQATYFNAFASARIKGRSELAFECSSPTHYRQFRMRIWLLRQGYAVANSMEVERPHEREILQPDYSHFEDSRITLCAGCRRTKNRLTPGTWDWVPYFLEDKLISVNHRLCPACRVYYRGSIGFAGNEQRLAS